MPHLIKIDRSSIKKNPRAGLSHIDLPGRKTESKTVVKKDRIEYYIDGFLTGEMPNTLNLPESINIQISQPIQRLFSLLPDPPYLYKYENPELQCPDCYTLVKYKDLVEFSDDTDTWYDDRCPNCYCSIDTVLEKLSNEELGSYVA